ncbi:MAG: hypothetical protein ACOYY3_16825 [Chloroflexota bacterium]
MATKFAPLLCFCLLLAACGQAPEGGASAPQVTVTSAATSAPPSTVTFAPTLMPTATQLPYPEVPADIVGNLPEGWSLSKEAGGTVLLNDRGAKVLRFAEDGSMILRGLDGNFKAAMGEKLPDDADDPGEFLGDTVDEQVDILKKAFPQKTEEELRKMVESGQISVTPMKAAKKGAEMAIDPLAETGIAPGEVKNLKFSFAPDLNGDGVDLFIEKKGADGNFAKVARFSESGGWQERHDLTIAGQVLEGWTTEKGSVEITDGEPLFRNEIVKKGTSVPEANAQGYSTGRGYVDQTEIVEVNNGSEAVEVVIFRVKYFYSSGKSVSVVYSALNRIMNERGGKIEPGDWLDLSGHATIRGNNFTAWSKETVEEVYNLTELESLVYESDTHDFLSFTEFDNAVKSLGDGEILDASFRVKINQSSQW